MKLVNIELKELLDYVCKQLNQFFPDNNIVKAEALQNAFDKAIERTTYCFSHIKNKYFNQDNQAVFDYLNGDQYSMFLYFLANSAYKYNLNSSICSKIFLLNKSLFGVDAYYEVELPEVFLFVHPVSTILGRATYSNYFMVFQSCNIGSSNGKNPSFGEYVTLHPGSSVLGNCVIGENSRIGAGALLLDRSIEDNTTYIGGPGNFRLLKNIEKSPLWV